MLALVSANLIIYISTLNPLISSAQCYIEYAAPTLCETVESPLALVCSGLAPSGIQIQIMAWGVQSPCVAERNISFLRVLCMHEARPGLSMSRPPAWYRDPPFPTHIDLCGAWCFHTMRHTRPMSIACFFSLIDSSHLLSCSPSCLTKTLNYKQTNMCKPILLAFSSPVPNRIFLFPVRCVSGVRFLITAKCNPWITVFSQIKANC